MRKGMLCLLLVLLVLPWSARGEYATPQLTFVPEAQPTVEPTPAPSVEATATPAPTATPTPTQTPEPTPAPTPTHTADPSVPVLIDRINGSEHADFAFAEDAALFEVIFPQILNSDAAFLRFGEETLLVDCCTQGQAARILDMCAQLNITHIDRVLNTHPHEDHIGGFRDLIKVIDVDELWICYPETANTHIQAAVNFARAADIEVRTFGDGDVLTLGDATIEVWLLGNDMNRLNNCSAQLKITYGERTFLMAADLELEGQDEYVALKGEELDADVLKYPHHGLQRLTDGYAAAVSPLFSIVTNNMRDTEGKRYIQRTGMPTAWTVPGFVHLRTDGQTWICDRIVSIKKY